MRKQKLFLTLISAFFIFTVSCKSVSKKDIEYHTVQRGNFVISVTETGELEAVRSKMVFAPFVSWQIVSNLKITKIVDDGKQVEKGEVLIEFDISDVNKAITDAKAELEIAKAELRKAQANHQSQIEELITNLDIAKLNQKISELNLKLKAYEPEIEKKSIQLDLEKAIINLEKAEQEIENKKAINKEEISALDLKVQQASNKLDEAERTLKMMTVTAPAPGIAIIRRNWMSREKFNVNDQTWPGNPIIGLPDLSLMKVNVMINEVDIAKIDIGQKVEVRIDAFPDSCFYGHVTDIATLARTKDRESKVKVFDVSVLMDEGSEKLMPGMTVSSMIIVNNIEDTLYIPLDALFKKDGKNIVYLKNGNSFEERNVEVGAENDNFVIIAAGLKEGDEVALTEPFET